MRGKKGRFELSSRSGNSSNQEHYQDKRNGKSRGKHKNSGNGAHLIGTLRYQGSGNAWFYPDVNDASNEATGMDLQKFSRVFISSSKTSTAMNGDQVMVKIDRIGPPEWAYRRRGRAQKAAGMKAPDDEAAGFVTKIVERGMARIIGTYFQHGKFGHVQPDDAQIPEVNIDPPKKSDTDTPTPKPGQKVAVELTVWDLSLIHI